MLDWIVLLTPLLLIPVFLLLAFIGCAQILGIEEGVLRPPPEPEPENQPPTATIAEPVINGLQVTLNGSGSSDPDGDALTFAWTFGDNNTSTEPNPTHTYGAPGIYAVQLVVSDGTLTGAASRPVEVDNPVADAVLRLPGTDGNYASTPGTGPLDITGELDLRVELAAADWSPSNSEALISKSSAAYNFQLNANGRLRLQWNDGTGRSVDSSSSIPVPNGIRIWVRVTLLVDDGLGDHLVTFSTSPDGASWTNLGMPRRADMGGFTTSIMAAPGTPLGIGARPDGTSSLAGDVYRAQVLEGIDGPVVFDFDPEPSDVGQPAVTEGANAAVVSINQSGVSPAEIVPAP